MYHLTTAPWNLGGRMKCNTGMNCIKQNIAIWYWYRKQRGYYTLKIKILGDTTSCSYILFTHSNIFRTPSRKTRVHTLQKMIYFESSSKHREEIIRAQNGKANSRMMDDRYDRPSVDRVRELRAPAGACFLTQSKWSWSEDSSSLNLQRENWICHPPPRTTSCEPHLKTRERCERNGLTYEHVCEHTRGTFLRPTVRACSVTFFPLSTFAVAGGRFTSTYLHQTKPQNKFTFV